MAKTFMVTLNTALLFRKRLLTITPDFVDYKNTNFSKFEIAELRYGLQPIHGYKIRIGRLYCIDIKSLTGTILKIRFSTFYGIGKKKADSIYTSILNALFENFIDQISWQYVNEFAGGKDVGLLGVRLAKNGVLLREKSNLLLWGDIGLRNYWTYFSIIVPSSPADYKSFTYSTDWNAIVLYSVMKYILRAKGLLNNESTI